MVPHTARGVEAVFGQQLPAVFGDEVDGVDEVTKHRFGNEVVEADARPAWLDSLATLGDLVFELV